ncbi:hypothetical protein BCR32DRAFT_291955 [Anaeromyces robustus]|uniref:Uncharacterized protein n=1 Tax=Anaeromyces robustus TaxID=1754192 RepID=A0A1Y1XCL3_9FUNG|nr:hypothetical protein BCR32DRAFT_291955 [Anaeromyces robustus]|eukprot:ORX83465.1 hypothetical protein BCR32DRAFT_291955 [Anaeromyces robustus]
MNKYDNSSYSIVDNTNANSIKFFELAFIFLIIFSVVCKVTNYNYTNSSIVSKIHNFIITKLSNEEKGLISYRNEISLYGLQANQVDIVISKNDTNKLPANHISNISPTNNFPMSTPNIKIDENGNIIPNDTFLKSNPFLIPNNSINKKSEVKENPNQYPTIIVTLPNEAILPYSPKIPMDIYYREGWVDYSNPNAESNTNAYIPKEMHQRKTYDYNYLAPLIPKNHSSLKLQQSFITKHLIQKEIEKSKNQENNTNSSSSSSSSSISHSESQSQNINTESNPSSSIIDNEKIILNVDDSNLIGCYYMEKNVNEYAEEYELVNHAFWWQEDCNQQQIIAF